VLIDAANVLDLDTGIVGLARRQQPRRADPGGVSADAGRQVLNTMNVSMMMMGQHSRPAPHNAFMAGNDADAKREVAGCSQPSAGRPT
jgi:hypothetical protein